MKKILLANLNESVMSALDFFSQHRPPRLNRSQYKFPIVVGSGNAYNSAAVLFSNQPAVIANESNFTKILKNYRALIKNKTIDQALIISASGEKDSIWETKLAKKYGLKTTLLTCQAHSSAAQLADRVLAYEKLPEPYTYNTSTYLGMFLGASKESATAIKKFINSLKLPKNFGKYRAYSFILPDDFSTIGPMLEIKRHELFGPYLSLRAFSFGEARHAKFVNNWDKELVISLGKNEYFGHPQNRWEIKTPDNAGPAFILALTYYLIGIIQGQKIPYFKKNIARFCVEGPQAYGQTKAFDIIVK